MANYRHLDIIDIDNYRQKLLSNHASNYNQFPKVNTQTTRFRIMVEVKTGRRMMISKTCSNDKSYYSDKLMITIFQPVNKIRLSYQVDLFSHYTNTQHITIMDSMFTNLQTKITLRTTMTRK